MTAAASMLPHGTIVIIGSQTAKHITTARHIVKDAIGQIGTKPDRMPARMTFDNGILRFVGNRQDAYINGTALPGLGLHEGDPLSAAALLLTTLDAIDSRHVLQWPEEAIAWNRRRRSHLGGSALSPCRSGSGEMLSTPWSQGRTIWDPASEHRGDVPDDEETCGPRPIMVGLSISDAALTYHIGLNQMIMGRIEKISTMDALRHLSAYRRRD